MLFRRHLPAVSRSLTAAAAMIAVLGIANCTTYVTGARDGTLSETLSSNAAVAATHASRASLGALLSDAGGTYISRLLADRDSTMERWPDHVSQPLRVWIDSSAAIS